MEIGPDHWTNDSPIVVLANTYHYHHICKPATVLKSIIEDTGQEKIGEKRVPCNLLAKEECI